MTFETEIMLRLDARVFTETIDHPVDAAAWSDHDVEVVLMQILRAVDRRLNPGGPPDRPIALRGITWIVHAGPAGHVLALEIHSASAVAGPFDLPVEQLDGMVSRVVRAASAPQVVH